MRLKGCAFRMPSGGAEPLPYRGGSGDARPNLQKRGDKDVQKPIRDMTYAEWERRKRSAGGVPDAGSGILDMFSRIASDQTIEQDLAAVNPNYSTGEWKWQNNCQRCVMAYEMRRRGYKVVAKPCENASDTLFSGGWIKVFRDTAYQMCPRGNGKEQIEAIMRRFGDGARAAIRVRFLNGFGHLFVAEQIDGKTEYYDPQNPNIDAKMHLILQFAAQQV